MEKYEHDCPRCMNKTFAINDYFCIRNRGRCEMCLAEEKANKEAMYWVRRMKPKLSPVKD